MFTILWLLMLYDLIELWVSVINYLMIAPVVSLVVYIDSCMVVVKLCKRYKNNVLSLWESGALEFGIQPFGKEELLIFSN